MGTAKNARTKTSKESSLKTKEYRLCDNRRGLMLILKTGKDKKKRLMVWDEKSEISRPIRHCPSEKSIFIDEQTEYAFVEPILFLSGYLEVDRTKQITQKFLDNHPDNAVNGGSWFEEINDEQEAEDDLTLEELKNDVYNAVRKKALEADGEYELEAVVAVLENSVQKASEMQLNSLKRRIYQQVQSNVEYFTDDNGNVNIFEDEYIMRKFFVLRAIKEGIIKKSINGKSMVWVKDNSAIASAPRGLELVEYFADFLGTDEGLLVSEEIKKRS
tara:strand:- start:2426 stop:3244 length:819 start_codon:yes stop_codon:yes gene_type:complete